MLTIERARELVDYDPLTGVFRWKLTRVGAGIEGRIIGGLDNKGYRRMQVGGQYCKAHRLAWFITYGEWPPEQIDHIDGDKDNNAIANLRLADCRQNNVNRSSLKTNTSGYCGVSWHAPGRRWRAAIHHKGKRISLGMFDTAEAASAAYEAASARINGEFAYAASRRQRSSAAIQPKDSR